MQVIWADSQSSVPQSLHAEDHIHSDALSSCMILIAFALVGLMVSNVSLHIGHRGHYALQRVIQYKQNWSCLHGSSPFTTKSDRASVQITQLPFLLLNSCESLTAILKKIKICVIVRPLIYLIIPNYLGIYLMFSHFIFLSKQLNQFSRSSL